jgi:hypothetical protein
MFFSSFIEIFWRLGRLADASNLTRALPDASERTQYQVPPPGCWNYFYAMYGVIPGHGWCPHRPQSRLLDPCAPRCALAYPNPVSRQMLPSFFFAPCAVPFPDAGGSPGRGWSPPETAEPPARPERSQTRIGVPRSRPPKTRRRGFFLRPIRRYSRTRGTTRVLGALSSNPFACGAFCSPRALPDAHRRAQIPPPKTRHQGSPCDLFAAVPGRRATTRVFGALCSNPPSHAESPARPKHSQTRIGVPKSRPLKIAAKDFYATYSALFQDAGALPAFSEPSARTPSHADPPARPERSQTRIGVPRSRPGKHAAKFFFFLRPNRRCSRTRGHYPCSWSPLLEPLHLRSRLLTLSAPRRASACPDPAP